MKSRLSQALLPPMPIQQPPEAELEPAAPLPEPPVGMPPWEPGSSGVWQYTDDAGNRWVIYQDYDRGCRGEHSYELWQARGIWNPCAPEQLPPGVAPPPPPPPPRVPPPPGVPPAPGVLPPPGVIVIGPPPEGLIQDPETGFLFDPMTGRIHDPLTGEPTNFAIDPTTGQIIDIRTGLPADPEAVAALVGVEETPVAGKLAAVGAVAGGIVLAALLATGSL